MSWKPSEENLFKEESNHLRQMLLRSTMRTELLHATLLCQLHGCEQSVGRVRFNRGGRGLARV